MQNKYNKTGGYTIIETMISISVFLVIIMYGMGSLLNANLLFQKSQDNRSIIDSLNFIMEDMSRNLRTGYNYRCYYNPPFSEVLSSDSFNTPRSCASGWAIAFETADGSTAQSNDQWVYSIAGGKILKSTDGATTAIQLTPNEVSIDAFSGFSVLGAEPSSVGNSQQPLITIRLSGSITSKGVVTPFSLQTSVSQRLLDL